MQREYEVVLQAEQSVLGALMMDPERLVEIRGILDEEDFLDEKNKTIYGAIIKLSDEDNAIDPTTIFNEVGTNPAFNSIDAAAYIVNIYEVTPTSRNAAHYANIVKKNSIYREVKDILVSNMQKMNSGAGDLDHITAEVTTKIEAAIERNKVSEFKNIKDVTQEVWDAVMAKKEGKVNNNSIPTGFSSLDALLHGFTRGDLVILAARPSMGKTAFALNIALNVAGRPKEDAEDKKTVAIFSLEMGADQLVNRMICSEGLVDSEKLRTGNLNNDDMYRFENGINFLRQKNIFIEDSAFIKVNEVKAKCKKLKREEGLDLIVIDYLQLLQGSRRTDNRQQEVSEISRSLKQMARELDCPVVALSQLSRSVESRQDKRPMMSDLRESGSIEQDADIVAFLYRDDYYNREEDEDNPMANKDVTTIEVIVAKHRAGQTGDAELAFLKKHNKFVSKQQGAF
ncbi:MAG: replicative DNA helicase [Gemella sp.]|nr:replicative DNA helicase [Gemella sp.]